MSVEESEMFRIAVCDDYREIRAEVKELLLKYSIKKDLDYYVDDYENGEALLAANKEFDLIIMDYQFQKGQDNGIDIAKRIRRDNKEVAIVFLSSFPDIVFESFEVDAYRFLVKPIDESRFFRTLDDLIRDLESDDILLVKVDGMNHFIKGKKISFVEGDGKYCIIHFIDKSVSLESRETLSGVEKRLSEKTFFRCHKSYLVNMKYIASYNHTDVILENGEVLYISKLKYKSFCMAYAKYLLEHKRI